jgi:hypothetical protein
LLSTRRGLPGFYYSFSVGAAPGGEDEISSAGVAPLSSDAPTQSPAQILVPLTVPTSLQPIGVLGFARTIGFPPTVGFFAREHLERRRRYQPRWPRMPRSAAGRPSISSAPRKLRIRGRCLWYSLGMDFKLGTSTKVGFAFLVFSAGPARRNQCNETCARRFLPA